MGLLPHLLGRSARWLPGRAGWCVCGLGLPRVSASDGVEVSRWVPGGCASVFDLGDQSFTEEQKKKKVDMSVPGEGTELEFITGTDNEETKTRTELEIHRPPEMLPNPRRREAKACGSDKNSSRHAEVGWERR